MNKKRINLLATASAILILIISSCASKTPSDLAGENIIPAPVSAISDGGWFLLKKNTDIFIKGGSEELQKTGEYLAGILRLSTGLKLEVKEAEDKSLTGGIFLELAADSINIKDEWYELNISKKAVTLKAVKPEGIFRGVQTLLQLLPAEAVGSQRSEGPWKIATGKITDYPEYSYRGAMLDVSRHFFSVEDVKRFTDLISYYKMNVLHLHLSDDQGWRIEIKSWPNLALHGGSTEVGGGKGGYYTQEQYADIVRYAAERYVTIVPEIDMPGHTNAALASYPELNCDGRARELYTGTNVGFSTLCAGKEITYKFVEDVVKEISALTPGPWFHMGGDESHVTSEKDYRIFVEKVQDIVNAHGKTVIGWDEIATVRMNDNSIAQFWGKDKNALKAAEQGRKVIFSPASRAYLDMKYDSTTKTGLHWAGYIEVDKAYSWDPAAFVSGIGREDIIGVEAPLWSETVTGMDEIEFMTFPRLPGIAEIGWTPALKRDWAEYRERLAMHAKRFERLGIDFYRSPLVPWK